MRSNAPLAATSRPAAIAPRPRAQLIFATDWARTYMVQSTFFHGVHQRDAIVAKRVGVPLVPWIVDRLGESDRDRIRALQELMRAHDVSIATVIGALNERCATCPSALDDHDDAIYETHEDWLLDLLRAVTPTLAAAPVLAGQPEGMEQLLAEAIICCWLPGLRLSDLRKEPALAVAVAAFLGPPAEEPAIWAALQGLIEGDDQSMARIHGNRLVLRLANLGHAMERRIELLRGHLQGDGDRVELREVAQKPLTEGLAQTRRIEHWVDEALDGLYGMQAARSFLTDLGRLATARRIHQAAGATTSPRVRTHVALVGPPGVGKSTFGRRYAGFLHRAGLIPRDHVVEVGARDLIGRYIGATTPLVKEVCARARGGVLFIDEAYALVGASDRDYGHEAIVALMRAMDDAGDALTVVFAGYEAPLLAMMRSNPGLQSRVPVIVRFAPLQPLESGQLLMRLAQDDGLDVEPGLLDCWLGLDLICALPSDGRSVELLYQRLLCGSITDRACQTQQRLSLRVADLGAVLLPADPERGDTALHVFSALDDDPS